MLKKLTNKKNPALSKESLPPLECWKHCNLCGTCGNNQAMRDGQVEIWG